MAVTGLSNYLGKHIKDICVNAYTKDVDNHCAHFVSHCLDYRFGVTCRLMGKANANGANIRVQEIFARSKSVGTWAARPKELTECLVFMTRAANVNISTKVMNNVPRKHIGIFSGGLSGITRTASVRS